MNIYRRVRHIRATRWEDDKKHTDNTWIKKKDRKIGIIRGIEMLIHDGPGENRINKILYIYKCTI